MSNTTGRLPASLLFALVAIASPALSQHEGHAAGKAPALGTIVFPNSGNRAAQTPFLRGVALLHSFEYHSAASAFREAQAADPGLALAYWGEALTYSHVLWRTEDLAASRAVLQRLASTPKERLAKARTPRERSFGAAVEAFFMDAPLPQRVRAYADSMRKHAVADPNDQEAAAFAAHALMLHGMSAASAERDALFGDAIGLAQRVAIRNPDHPGATHYLIHLYDSPGMAAQGLAFARAYDKIAPDAEHALHMPSHIYLQLGLWDDVARSNERAWAASRAGTTNAGQLDWHAYSWLHYAYLQQGRWTAARALIDSARTILSGVPASYTDAAFVLTRLEFQQGAETGRWLKPLTPPLPTTGAPASERERGFRSFSTYWLAVDAALRGDANLPSLAAPFLAIADSVRGGTFTRSPVMASNALVVYALAGVPNGDSAAATKAWRAAIEQERKLNAFVGPPERVFAGEIFAVHTINRVRRSAALDEAARRNALAEPISALENVLRLCPNRSQTLSLLGIAQRLAGDSVGAAATTARLRVNWKNADAELLRLLR
jgi:tetratricopeptide (TPR) repeat protein